MGSRQRKDVVTRVLTDRQTGRPTGGGEGRGCAGRSPPSSCSSSAHLQEAARWLTTMAARARETRAQATATTTAPAPPLQAPPPPPPPPPPRRSRRRPPMTGGRRCPPHHVAPHPRPRLVAVLPRPWAGRSCSASRRPPRHLQRHSPGGVGSRCRSMRKR